MPSTQTEMETYTLGSWGVLCAQFAHYMSLNKRDSIWMKLFVAGLVLMTTLKIVQSLVIMWIQNVTTFGDLEAGSNLWRKHWLWKVTIILEATTEFYVQMFFCRRLWAISRNAYFVIICIVLFLLGLITGVVAVCLLQLYSIGTNFCNTDLLPIHKYLGIDNPLGWNTSWSCAVRRPDFDRKHNMLFAFRSTSPTLRVNKFCCQHENKHDDLDTRTANDWQHLKPGTSSVVRVVRNVDSQLAR
ncbi:hypothetical protein B0H14DRAFT_3141999 [Mycena olivaceomarginata]|nr:hypothetical protein B0H14DRAFT_3141999 [Mycena olivaceomarginata]